MWESLAKAYLGPPLHVDVGRRFPEHFETELRGSPEHPDLMHIVSGRMQLGVVRQREAATVLAHHAQLDGAEPGSRRGNAGGQPSPPPSDMYVANPSPSCVADGRHSA